MAETEGMELAKLRLLKSQIEEIVRKENYSPLVGDRAVKVAPHIAKILGEKHGLRIESFSALKGGEGTIDLYWENNDYQVIVSVSETQLTYYGCKIEDGTNEINGSMTLRPRQSG